MLQLRPLCRKAGRDGAFLLPAEQEENREGENFHASNDRRAAKQAEESLGQVSSKETLASFWQEYLSKNG